MLAWSSLVLLVEKQVVDVSVGEGGRNGIENKEDQEGRAEGLCMFWGS